MSLANTWLVDPMALPRSIWAGRAISQHCRIETQIIEGLVQICPLKMGVVTASHNP